MKKTNKLKIFTAAIAILFSLTACDNNRAADRIYINGDILTLDANNTVAQALATAGEEILAVGSKREIESLAGPDKEIVDLQGKALLPGFIAAHEHPAISAVFRNFVDMSGFSHGDAVSAAWSQENSRTGSSSIAIRWRHRCNSGA